MYNAIFHLAAVMVGNIYFAAGYPNISIPDVGNCGDDTLIMCEIAAFKGGWGLFQNGNLVISRTTRINETAKKYSFISAGKDVTISIHNTNVFTDAGQYICFSQFIDSSPATLAVECKAKNVQVTTDETNRLLITADQLFPNNVTFTTMTGSQPYAPADGSSKCEPSSEYSGYYKCVWLSSFPFKGGTYAYSVTVKTITESETFTGIIAIGPPCVPSNITVKNIKKTSATLSWTPCSHGGLYQAISIQLSRDNVNWINLIIGNRRNISFTPTTSYNLHSLEASSVYYVRFAALNDTEIISVSDIVEFRTLSENLSNAEYTTVLIAGAVGGLIIILIIIACAVFIYKYKKGEDARSIQDISGDTTNSSQHAHVAGPSNENERNTGDMICVNRSFDNQVPGRTLQNVFGSQIHADT